MVTAHDIGKREKGPGTRLKEQARSSTKGRFQRSVMHALSAVLASLILATGCNLFDPPVERRISKYQEVFNAFPPGIRENLRLGKIGIGYTEDMVRIAFGSPDRRYRRRSQDGETEIWAYRGESARSHHHWIRLDLPMLDPQGHRITRREELKFDLDDHTSYTKTRIEFSAGKVIALEELTD